MISLNIYLLVQRHNSTFFRGFCALPQIKPYFLLSLRYTVESSSADLYPRVRYGKCVLEMTLAFTSSRCLFSLGMCSIIYSFGVIRTILWLIPQRGFALALPSYQASWNCLFLKKNFPFQLLFFSVCLTNNILGCSAIFTELNVYILLRGEEIIQLSEIMEDILIVSASSELGNSASNTSRKF